MSGFGVSAVKLGLPDTGLISYGEMLAHGKDICAAVEIPIIGDADTGYPRTWLTGALTDSHEPSAFLVVWAKCGLAARNDGHMLAFVGTNSGRRSRENWWRRRESNPRPKTFTRSLYMLIRFQFFSPPSVRSRQGADGSHPLFLVPHPGRDEKPARLK